MRNKKHQNIDLYLGNHEIIINERYEFFYNLNDVFIALLFLVGSIFFLWSSLEIYGVWMFIIGSALFLIRPLIQFTKKIHLRKIKERKQP